MSIVTTVKARESFSEVINRSASGKERAAGRCSKLSKLEGRGK